MANETQTEHMPPCVDCGKEGWAFRDAQPVCFGCGLLYMSDERTARRYRSAGVTAARERAKQEAK